MKNRKLNILIKKLIQEQIKGDSFFVPGATSPVQRPFKPSTSPVRKHIPGFPGVFADDLLNAQGTKPIGGKSVLMNLAIVIANYALQNQPDIASGIGSNLIDFNIISEQTLLNEQGITVNYIGGSMGTGPLGWIHSNIVSSVLNLPLGLQAPVIILVAAFLDELVDGDGNITGFGEGGFITNTFNSIKNVINQIFGANVDLLSEFTQEELDYIEGVVEEMDSEIDDDEFIEDDEEIEYFDYDNYDDFGDNYDSDYDGIPDDI